MKKLVVVSQPRSCSTWLMNQLRRSPVLEVIKESFGELTPPSNRWHTRNVLGLDRVDDPEIWTRDIGYATHFFQQHPNGCFKLLGHANMAQFYRYMYGRNDVHFVTLYRQDVASALASLINVMIRSRLGNERTSFKEPANSRKTLYADIDKFGFKTGDWKRAKLLEFFYYALHVKAQRWLEYFDGHPNNIASLQSENIREQAAPVEEFAEVQFKWDTLQPQSVYRDVFVDWQEYERDIRDIIGITP